MENCSIYIYCGIYIYLFTAAGAAGEEQESETKVYQRGQQTKDLQRQIQKVPQLCSLPFNSHCYLSHSHRNTKKTPTTASTV